MWWKGIHRGFKNPRLIPCGFESHHWHKGKKMGYYISQQNSNIIIKKDNVRLMYLAFNKYMLDKKIIESNEPDAKNTLDSYFDYFAFEYIEDDDGSIDEIHFRSEKLTDYFYSFMKLIAPFVEDNQELEFIGEDGAHMLYFFKDKKVKIIDGKVVYDRDSGKYL